MNKTIIKSPIKIREIRLNYSGANILFNSFKIPLIKGYNYVKLTNLPLEENDDVYFKNTTKHGYEVLSIERVYESKQNDKANKLTQQLRDKQIDIDTVENELDLSQYKLNLYRKAFNVSGDIDDPSIVEASVNKYKKLTEEERKHYIELKSKLSELNNSYDELKKELLDVKEEKQYNLYLTVYSDSDQELELYGQINTQKLSFEPRYTFTGNTETNKASLNFEGVIRNNLRYRFKDCNIKFECRNNYNNDCVPTYIASDFDQLLHDIFGFGNPIRPISRALTSTRALSLDNKVSKSTNATNHVIKIDKLVTIPERSHDIVIPLEETPLDGSFKYVTLPSVENSVYLTYEANVKNLSLIDTSDILINVDDTLIPLSRFEIDNNKMTITIKKVDFLKVKRTSTSKHTCNLDSESDSSVKINYNIIIENNSDKNVSVNVIESLPKSNNSDIKVKIIHPEANEIVHDKETDSFKLDKVYTINSNDKINIDIDYEITGKLKPLLNF